MFLIVPVESVLCHGLFRHQSFCSYDGMAYAMNPHKRRIPLLLLVFLVVLGLYVVEEFPLPDKFSQSEVIEVFVGDEEAVV